MTGIIHAAMPIAMLLAGTVGGRLDIAALILALQGATYIIAYAIEDLRNGKR